MSKTKDEIEEAEAEWAAEARREGYRCEMCGGVIPYEERKAYFRTRRCFACQERPEETVNDPRR
jgi:RNA polymerase-binding transcription factor DksA